ncbi:MAG: extracytoplasmic sigma factor ECF [Pirellulaceae bacterium]|nr:MAG: extracytoplasmic sigma factor ECF [Pirellulaceae bacterium]
MRNCAGWRRTMMAREKPGQTLSATALVHEAYLRLVERPARTGDAPNSASADPVLCADEAAAANDDAAVDASTREAAIPHGRSFANRRHFFAAAAEAMRRILVENARRKARLKHGGGQQRVHLDDSSIAAPDSTRQYDILAVDEALEKLARAEPLAAELVKLRYFAGLGHQEAASLLGLTRRAADRLWLVARAWLFQTLAEPDSQ